MVNKLVSANSARNRLEMIQRGMWVSIPVAVVFSGLDMSVGAPLLGGVEAITAAIMGLLLFSTFKKPDTVDFIAQMVVLCTAVIFFTILMTGGFTNQGFIWSVGFPFVACFLVGARRGAIWSLIYATGMAVVMLFDWHAYAINTYTMSEAAYIGTTYGVFGFLAYFMNMAHERSMHENLRLRVAMEQVSDAVSIMDLHGDVVFANLACKEFYGKMQGAMPGEPAVYLSAGDVNGDLTGEVTKALNRGATWKGELKIQTLRGLRTMRRVVSPVSDGGVLRYHVYMDHDITDEHQQQKQLEHTQRLESLGVLAGGIAHDFNNILTAIMGNAAMAGRQMDDASPAKELLCRIESSTQRAADLCKQMLAYSGKGKFVVKAVNLSALVEEMTRLMEVSIEKNVVIKYALADNLPVVQADVAQLQQVILNLITNANEAIGRKSGVISFSTGVMRADRAYLDSTISVGGVAEGRYVFVEVSDTGCGMDADTIHKMFDPFFTTKFTGRGLGMSAVLGIVRGHHGALKVYSELGKGTTFKMLLPAIESVDSSAVVTESGVKHHRLSGTVLVIDDEETVREVASMMFEHMGLKTLTAVDGLHGVEVYRQHSDKIIAVLLDMTMPKMDGKACFRELRRINPEVRVILSSGYNEQEATNRFVGQGLAGFIQKPYSPEALNIMMNEIVGANEC